MMQAFIYVPVYGLPQGAGGKLGPHLTILYSEDAHGELDVWEEACDLIADRIAGTQARYTGAVEMFGHDERVPVALVQSQGLRALRRSLLAFLAEHGASAQVTYEDFRPHVTLKPDTEVEAGDVILGPLCLRLMNGKEVVHQFCWGADVPLAQLTDDERTPTQEMADAARRALDVRADKPPSERGMTRVGLARARQLINRQALSPSTIRRMASYFARHEDDKRGSTWDDQGKGWQAWHGWGGDAGRDWAERLVGKLNRDIAAQQRLSQDSVSVPQSVPTPEGFVVGRPFRFAAVGEIYDRHGGKRLGAPFTRELLADALRWFEVSGDALPIDREHKESDAGGLAVGMALVDGGDAIAVLPAYNATRPSLCQDCARGVCSKPEHEPLAEYVDRLNGVLWPSPRVQWGQFHAADDGRYVGRLRFPNIAVTTEPATCHSKVDQVRLNQAQQTSQENAMNAIDTILARYQEAGMPEQAMQALRSHLEGMPDNADADALEAAAAALVAGMIVEMNKVGEESVDGDEDDEAAGEGEAESSADEDDEAAAEPEASAAEGEADADEAMAQDELADEAMAETVTVSRDELRAMIDEAVEQRYGQAVADPATPDPIDADTGSEGDGESNSPDAWDMTDGDAEVRFNEGLARGTFTHADRGVFMSFRRRVDAGSEPARDAMLEHFGQTPRMVEARLSAPGHRAVERTGAEESAHAELRRLGEAHPRGTAGVLADWDRTGDTRLNDLA